MKKIWLLLLSSIFCVITVADGTGSAHSSHSPSSGAEQFAEMIAYYHDLAIDLSDDEFAQLKSVILRQWDEGEITTVESRDNFDFDKIRGVAFDDEATNLKAYYVFIPFRESAGHYMPLSGITFAFSGDKTIVQAHEVIIDEEENALDINIYSNGALIGAASVDASQPDRDGGMIRPFGYWEDVAECLQQFGANGPLVASALATCTAVCSLTGPAGCAACLGIYLAVDAGIIVGCLIP